MSRYFMISSWVGSHENEPDYNGQQCGERNVRSSEVVPLYDQYGNANTKAFSDEAIEARKKASTKPKAKRSAFSQACLADSNYERLQGISEALDDDLENGVISFEDWDYAKKNLQPRLDRAWKRIEKVRGWGGEEEEAINQINSVPSFHQKHSWLKGFTSGVECSNLVFNSLSDDNMFKQAYLVFKKIRGMFK